MAWDFQKVKERLKRSFFMYKYLLALAFTWCACNNNAGSNNAKDTAQSSQTIHNNISDTVVTGAKPFALNGCYQMTLKKDTAKLNLTVKDSTVTGDLQYHWYARDANEGTLKGVLRNNMIYADYTFRSEGLTSVRELVLKIQDSVLLQGYGPMQEQKGRMVFQKKDSLKFQTSHPFRKTACK